MSDAAWIAWADAFAWSVTVVAVAVVLVAFLKLAKGGD